jgi:hypothetical protein
MGSVDPLKGDLNAETFTALCGLSLRTKSVQPGFEAAHIADDETKAICDTK